MGIALRAPQAAHVRGDSKSISIAAASILADTTHDERMRILDRIHPRLWVCRSQGLSGAGALRGPRQAWGLRLSSKVVRTRARGPWLASAAPLAGNHRS